MGRRIRDRTIPGENPRIVAEKLVPGGLIRFSFKYLQIIHPSYNPDERGAGYFLTLLGRLRELSNLTMESLQNRKSDPVIRFHPIDFRDPRVTAEGFGIPRCDSFNVVAWQFALTRNEHGRVHGFVIEDTFFVVWLDPEHRLYG